ncbi:hypothetical protein AFCDBAGC_4934 [Methylobacterium cerastii]|uniref:Uncharacterized protein n=1 Tax=Methylobacterium cerastii TaxID=932741 RepID=A0ABQ4QPV2_9HYPH|nr:hypothetical protein AFCDBAGC_4934 [Methylobacterium cerastii]
MSVLHVCTNLLQEFLNTKLLLFCAALNGSHILSSAPHPFQHLRPIFSKS